MAVPGDGLSPCRVAGHAGHRASQLSAEIADAARRHALAGRLGIDTEFMSEGRYRALLCLVQVVVDEPTTESRRSSSIDALDRGDIAPLAELLADPAIEVVLHAGRQDVAILRRAWQTELNNIFDTQIAAGFAGASAQAGYGTCSARCSACASARPPATPAGTRAR